MTILPNFTLATELSAPLLLNLSAAFDVMDHKILLAKLLLYKLSTKAISWFSSYMEGRRRVVVVELRTACNGNQGTDKVQVNKS